MLQQQGVPWLTWSRTYDSLSAVRQELCSLRGVRPKMADCVALFSLDQHGCIPVDTHVWEIACRDLDPALKACPSLTPAVYARVGELFRQKYGAHAGWAHSLLFAAELPLFSSRLPESTRLEMAEFKAEGKAKRQEAKTAMAARLKSGKQEGQAEAEGGGSAPDGAAPKAKAKPKAKGARKRKAASD